MELTVRSFYIIIVLFAPLVKRRCWCLSSWSTDRHCWKQTSISIFFYFKWELLCIGYTAILNHRLVILGLLELLPAPFRSSPYTSNDLLSDETIRYRRQISKRTFFWRHGRGGDQGTITKEFCSPVFRVAIPAAFLARAGVGTKMRIIGAARSSS